MYPNRCEEPGCGKEEITVILAAWYDEKLRCRECYNRLWEAEQRRLRVKIRQNSEAMRLIEMQRLAKRGQAG